MAISSFSRSSLAIEVEGPHYTPHTLAIRGPVQHHLPRSRVVLHETLHLWQHLAHGFLTQLAVEEWRRLLHFEDTGTIPPPGPTRQEHSRVHPKLGFSASTLNEALTRFWEMNVCNPLTLLELERAERRFTQDEFWARYDMVKAAGALTGPDGTGYSDIAFAMGMQGAGGRYAAPYQRVIDQTGRGAAGLLFPIAAHMAFQTTRPTDYFDLFVDALADTARAIPPGPIEALWVQLYFKARGLLFPIIQQRDEAPLWGVTIMEAELQEHPSYRIAFARLDYLMRLLGPSDIDLARALPPGPRALPPEKRGWLMADIILATPGIPDHRGMLFQYLPPPVVRFSDGGTWILGEVHRQEAPMAAVYEVDELRDDAAASLDLLDRWRGMMARRYGG